MGMGNGIDLELRAAMEYIADLGVKAQTPQQVELCEGGPTFFNRPLSKPDLPLVPALVMGSLTGLAEFVNAYLKGKTDDDKTHLYCLVRSPIQVELYTEIATMAGWPVRQMLAVAKYSAQQPTIGQSIKMHLENFICELQCGYVENQGKLDLMELLTGIDVSQGVHYADDGLSQTVTGRTGITKRGVKKVPAPIMLIPYRSFAEIEPVESAFIVRLYQSDQFGVQVTIAEADNGRWTIENNLRIKGFLRKGIDYLCADKITYLL